MRARWFKPETFQDRALAKAGPTAFVVYWALRCMADDGGVSIIDPDIVYGQMFLRWPQIPLVSVISSLQILTHHGLIEPYQIGEDHFAKLVGWKTSDITKKTKFRYPRPTASSQPQVPQAVTIGSQTWCSDGEVMVSDRCSDSHLLESYNPRILESYSLSHAAHDDEKKTKPSRKHPELVYSDDFESLWSIYPKRAGTDSKKAAYRAFEKSRRRGATVDAMRDGLARYIAQLEANGSVGTKFVMQASRFFGSDECWLDEYPLPVDEHPFPTKELDANGYPTAAYQTAIVEWGLRA